MRMELRCRVSIYRAGGVVLEGCGHKSAGGFGSVVAADASLRVAFQLIESEGHGLAMRFANLVITSHQGRQRDGLRRGESSVPTCTVFHGRDSPPVFGLVFVCDPVLDQFFAGSRMLAFCEPGKLQRADAAR